MQHTFIDFWMQAFMKLGSHIMHGGVPKDIAFLPSLIIRAVELYPENSQSWSDFAVTWMLQ